MQTFYPVAAQLSFWKLCFHSESCAVIDWKVYNNIIDSVNTGHRYKPCWIPWWVQAHTHIYIISRVENNSSLEVLYKLWFGKIIFSFVGLFGANGFIVCRDFLWSVNENKILWYIGSWFNWWHISMGIPIIALWWCGCSPLYLHLNSVVRFWISFEIIWWPVDSPHKGLIRWKAFPSHDAIMNCETNTPITLLWIQK